MQSHAGANYLMHGGWGSCTPIEMSAQDLMCSFYNHSGMSVKYGLTCDFWPAWLFVWGDKNKGITMSNWVARMASVASFQPLDSFHTLTKSTKNTLLAAEQCVYELESPTSRNSLNNCIKWQYKESAVLYQMDHPLHEILEARLCPVMF